MRNVDVDLVPLCGQYIRCYKCDKVVPLEESTSRKSYGLTIGGLGGQGFWAASPSEHDWCKRCSRKRSRDNMIFFLISVASIIGFVAWLFLTERRY